MENYSIIIYQMKDENKKYNDRTVQGKLTMNKRCVEDINFNSANQGQFKVACKVKEHIYKRFNLNTMVSKNWTTPESIPENAYDEDIKKCFIAQKYLEIYKKITISNTKLFPLKCILDLIMQIMNIKIEIEYLKTYKISVKSSKGKIFWAQLEENCTIKSGFVFQKLLRNDIADNGAATVIPTFCFNQISDSGKTRTGSSLHVLLMYIYIFLFIYYTYVKYDILILDIQGCIGITTDTITLFLTDPDTSDGSTHTKKEKRDVEKFFNQLYNEIINIMKGEIEEDKIPIPTALDLYITFLGTVFSKSFKDNKGNWFDNDQYQPVEITNILSELENLKPFIGKIKKTKAEIEAAFTDSSKESREEKPTHSVSHKVFDRTKVMARKKEDVRRAPPSPECSPSSPCPTFPSSSFSSDSIWVAHDAPNYFYHKEITSLLLYEDLHSKTSYWTDLRWNPYYYEVDTGKIYKQEETGELKYTGYSYKLSIELDIKHKWKAITLYIESLKKTMPSTDTSKDESADCLIQFSKKGKSIFPLDDYNMCEHSLIPDFYHSSIESRGSSAVLFYDKKWGDIFYKIDGTFFYYDSKKEAYKMIEDEFLEFRLYSDPIRFKTNLDKYVIALKEKYMSTDSKLSIDDESENDVEEEDVEVPSAAYGHTRRTRTSAAEEEDRSWTGSFRRWLGFGH
jgi:hypothetical protein